MEEQQEIPIQLLPAAAALFPVLKFRHNWPISEAAIQPDLSRAVAVP